MKNKFLHKALCLFLSGTMLASVGCKDYDDDIQDLNNRLDKAVASIQELRDLVEAGSVIEKVEKTDDGVTVVLSDGTSWTLTNGQDGQDAAVWTINGDDGYWYKDGVKTPYKAIGVDGKDGNDGKDGEDGKDGNDGNDGNDGEDGIYYVPNPKTGHFDIYKNGEWVKDSGISYIPSDSESAGIVAVMSGNTLTLSNLTDADGKLMEPATIVLGSQLGSVEFVPEVMSSEVAYPTTTDEFYHIATYVSEEKFAADRTFIPQDGWDKSNEVAMVYRLNPTDAYVNGAVAAFINRDVTTRAAAFNDESDLLNVVEESLKFGDAGDVTLKSTVNPRAMSKDINIAALQVWAGQNPVTSDYIHIATKAIAPVIANTKSTVSGSAAVEFYNRTKSVKSGEDDAFVKQFVGNVGDANYPKHFSFKYDGSIDLKPLAALYTNDVKKYLTEIGFTGISYKFSKPSEYKADDDKKTNQQAYISLEDGVVKVNSEYNTSAIGRTPIVRVDAYMTSNGGTEVMVASAYIKLSISREEVDVEDKPANKIKIGETLTKNYRDMKETADYMIADMPWDRISKEVYDVEGLTSANFWDSYENTYDVKVTASGAAKSDVLIDENVSADAAYDTKAKGVRVQINLNKAEQTSSYVKVSVDDTVLTDHTYGKGGAKYNVEITVKSKDPKVHGDFVFTQEFTMVDNHKFYTFNPLYHFTKSSSYGSIAGVTNDDIIVVKGQVKDDAWVMSSVVSEHFIKKNNLNIFNYYANDTDVPKVTGIKFDWVDDPVEDVTPDTEQTADFEVALDGAMESEYLVKAMRLTQTLENGEECSNDYDIVFVNPFVAGSANTLKIYGNGVGEQTVNVEPEVRVMDKDSDAIYTYSVNDRKLVLSSKATGEYKVIDSKVKVAYAFDEESEDYKTVTANMSDGSVLDVDDAGVVTWKNEGATLTKDYKLAVIATVTFEDLSVVECKIPVTLSATK